MIDRHGLITRSRIEYHYKLVYYNTETHNRIIEGLELLLGEKDDPLKEAWKRAPKGDPPVTLADIRVDTKRRVIFYMTPERFYDKAEKSYEEEKENK